MFKSYRRPVALYALGLAALSVFLWGVLWHPDCGDALKSLQKDNGQPEEAAYEGSVTCEQDCQVTFGLAPSAKRQSAEGQQKQNQTCDTTAELDLVQQMVMAHWAIVSALLAILALIGVLYTFRETHRLGKLQSRAYLSITKTDVTVFKDGKKFEAKIEIRNTGQTPAKDVRLRSTTTLIQIPTTRKLTEEAGRPPKNNPRFPLGADCPITVRSSHDQILNPPLIANIKAGRMAVIVIIKTDYVDVFGESQSEDFQLICHLENAVEGGALAGYSDEMISNPKP